MPPPLGSGYAPPEARRGRPAVITWYRVYTATIAAVYFGGCGVWWWLRGVETSPAYAVRVGAFLALVLLFGGLFVAGTFVPYKPWAWTFALVLICLGLSTCMVVASVPLLVYWLRPETKAAFGRL